MNSDQLTLAVAMRRARTVFSNREVVSRIDGAVVVHTYAQIFERADRLAWALRELGVGPGDRIGTLAWNHHRHLELYLAVTMSGAVLHTINVRLAPQQAVDIARHAGDKVIFVDSDLFDLETTLRAQMPDLAALVRLAPGDDVPPTDPVINYENLIAAQCSGTFSYPPLTEDMPAATSYSSATTGTPKGVVYTHRALLLHSMMSGLADTWAIGEADTILPVVPMFHVNAWGLPFTAMWMGSRLVLPGARPTAGDLLTLLADHNVTFSAAVPTVWMDILRLVARTGRVLPHLRLVVSGGAPLPRTLLEEADRLNVPMIHSYGMTEAAPLVLVGKLRTDAPDHEPDRLGLRLRQGYVVPGLDYRVIDAAGADIEWDGCTSGELLLRGPWVAEGYERDERSANAFADGWYRTGDIVTIDAGGYIHVVDRAADLIKSGGEWISSIELEDALMDHPAVQAAAVIGVPDERWTERPRAYLVLERRVQDDELREHLAARFPRFWLPDDYIELEVLPMTAVGKFDKKALRNQLSAT